MCVRKGVLSHEYIPMLTTEEIAKNFDGTNYTLDLSDYPFLNFPKNEEERDAFYKQMIIQLWRKPWYKRFWCWLRKVFHRLTYRKTISAVHFVVPPGYPLDTYSITNPDSTIAKRDN